MVAHVAGKPVANVAQLLSAVAALTPDTPAKLDLVRKEAKLSVDVTPGKRNLPKPQAKR